MVPRIKVFVAISLLAPLVGSGVSWAMALGALAHGQHHVAFDATAGRITIVLEHDASEHHHGHHDHAPASGHSHSTNEDHVVTLSAPDAFSNLPARLLLSAGGPALVSAVVIPFGELRTPSPACRACSGVGPPAPSRSSILRI